jgi:hypothetical protein
MPDCSDSIGSFALLTVSAIRHALVSDDCQAPRGQLSAPAALHPQSLAAFLEPRLAESWAMAASAPLLVCGGLKGPSDPPTCRDSG